MRDAVRVFREATPVALSYVPLAMLFGTLAHHAGLSALQTAALSLVVYSGAAQLIAVQMLAAGASHAAIVAAAGALTLRHVLMGASLSLYTRGLSVRERLQLFPFMTDESFALAWRRYRTAPGAHGYFRGANFYLYLTWNAATLAGFWAGERVPALLDLGLEVLLPLLFAAILAGLVTTRREALVTFASLGLLYALRSVLAVEWLVPLGGLIAAVMGAAIERPQARGANS